MDDTVADSGSEIDKDALWSEVRPRKAEGARFRFRIYVEREDTAVERRRRVR